MFIRKKFTATATAVFAAVATIAAATGLSTASAQTIYPENVAPPKYFVPEANYFVPNATVPNVIESRYYDPYQPLYRSQRGRDSNEPRGPITGDYDDDMTAEREPTPALYKERIREIFRRVMLDNEMIAYDNDTIPDATLDLRSLTNHDCFDPTGNEIARCSQRFGPFGNIKSSLLNGTLFTVLTDDDTDRSDNIGDLYKRMIEQITEEDEAEQITTVSQMRRESRKLRSQLLWEVCNEMFPSYTDASECFQRNARLVLDRDVDADIDAGLVD